MLQTIRDHTQGVVVWTIVGLIIITFALFGLNSYLSGSSKSYVASINGVEIDENHFRRELQNYQARLQQMLGKNFRADMFNPQMIKQEVVNSLINQELMTQYLDEHNYYVAPSLVGSEIRAVDAFKGEGGQFSKARYEELLAMQGMGQAYFEQQVARDVASRYVKTGISLTDFATDSEVKQFLRLSNQHRDIGYLSIPKKPYLKKLKVPVKDIEAYYNEHQNAFMNPEKVSVEYVELDLNKLAQGYAISEDELRHYYESHRQSYVSNSEQRKVSHILIKVDDKTDEKTALKKVTEIRRRLDKGESFAKLAKELSQDPGSAKQGGDLGFFGRGVMDKAFETTAFSLKKGEISKPVRSTFGYHLIKLEDIKPGKVKTFAEVKDSIKKDLQIEQAEQNFYDLTEKLNNITYEQPGSLQPVVDELGLPLKKTSLFDRSGGQGIAANPKVIEAAFSDGVLNLGRNSDLIELSDSHLIVLRKLGHQQASQKPLAEVSRQIADLLRAKMAQEKINQQLEKAKQRLAKGDSPKKVARSIKGAKWSRVGLIGRTAKDDKTKKAAKLDQQIRHKAFTLAMPENKQPTWADMALTNGDGVVIGLYRVQYAEQQKADEQQQTRLAQSSGNALFGQLLEQQRMHADIKINLPADTE